MDIPLSFSSWKRNGAAVRSAVSIAMTAERKIWFPPVLFRINAARQRFGLRVVLVLAIYNACRGAYATFSKVQPEMTLLFGLRK
jgi:hypothetical protein